MTESIWSGFLGGLAGEPLSQVGWCGQHNEPYTTCGCSPAVPAAPCHVHAEFEDGCVDCTTWWGAQ